MAAFAYYLVLPLIYGIALLPFPLLYVLSDVVFVLLYHVIGYRKKVVFTNLRKSFPEKSEAEIQEIGLKFYRFFCDLIFETLKTLTISPETLKKRVKMNDDDVFAKYYNEGRSVIFVMGHWGNWELGGARFSQEPYHQLYVIYHPLANKHFDKLVYHMRTRLGNKLYAMRDTIRGMIKNRGDLTATAFIADQTPSPKNAHWMPFLNQDTPVFTGTARIAKKLNYPVIYTSVKRVKRGYYEIHGEVLIENPQSLEEVVISELHTKRLEKDIQAQPEIWLWSHRRWKHQRKEENP